MAEELIKETEWTVEAYLALFEPQSPDYSLLKAKAENLGKIVVRHLRSPSGQLFEDTVFFEKSGLSYTIRARL